MPRVVLDRITKIFEGSRQRTVHAVRELSLTVEDGELVTLVGPSGSGKTTTLRLIAGLEELSSGTITIDGAVMNRVPPKERDIAMVFQHHALYPHMTVFENLAFGLKLRKVSPGEIDRRVREAAEWLELNPLLEARPESLSGGQRQRVALARAMVRQPKVFLLDEPLSNLDPQLRHQLRLEIARLRRRIAATMIHVTHDQAEAMTLGDRVGVMRGGALEQLSSPSQIYERPGNRFVAGFVGSPPMNFFYVTLVVRDRSILIQERNTAAVTGFVLPLEREQADRLRPLAGREVVLGLRAEHIRAVALSSEAGGIPITVAHVETAGGDSWLHGRTAAHPVVVRLFAPVAATSGESARVVFDLSHAHFFDAANGQAIV